MILTSSRCPNNLGWDIEIVTVDNTNIQPMKDAHSILNKAISLVETITN